MRGERGRPLGDRHQVGQVRIFGKWPGINRAGAQKSLLRAAIFTPSLEQSPPFKIFPHQLVIQQIIPFGASLPGPRYLGDDHCQSRRHPAAALQLYHHALVGIGIALHHKYHHLGPPQDTLGAVSIFQLQAIEVRHIQQKQGWAIRTSPRLTPQIAGGTVPHQTESIFLTQPLWLVQGPEVKTRQHRLHCRLAPVGRHGHGAAAGQGADLVTSRHLNPGQPLEQGAFAGPRRAVQGDHQGKPPALATQSPGPFQERRPGSGGNPRRIQQMGQFGHQTGEPVHCQQKSFEVHFASLHPFRAAFQEKPAATPPSLTALAPAR